nr:unnamed protein product [Spirometra erinaceieuropaei]
MAAVAELMTFLKIKLARLSSSLLSNRRRSPSQPRTVDICFYHTNFGAKARRCSSPARPRPSTEASQPENIPDLFLWTLRLWSHLLCLRQLTRKRFLVDTGIQISVDPPTPPDHRFPSFGLRLQVADCSSILTFRLVFLNLDIGLRPSFPGIFVIADKLHEIHGSVFLAEFDLLA